MKSTTPSTNKYLRALLDKVSRSVNARWQRSGGHHPCVAFLILHDNRRVLQSPRSTKRDLTNRLSETIPYLELWLECTSEPLPRLRQFARDAANELLSSTTAGIPT